MGESTPSGRVEADSGLHGVAGLKEVSGPGGGPKAEGRQQRVRLF